MHELYGFRLCISGFTSRGSRRLFWRIYVALGKFRVFLVSAFTLRAPFLELPKSEPRLCETPTLASKSSRRPPVSPEPRSLGEASVVG